MIKVLTSNLALARNVKQLKTSSDRMGGLLGFTKAPLDYAAVFHLPFGGFFPLVHTFGMKFWIDVFFCDRNKEVRSIFLNVKPNRFVFPFHYALGGCLYLIEFSGCSVSHVKVGERLEWEDP